MVRLSVDRLSVYVSVCLSIFSPVIGLPADLSSDQPILYLAVCIHKIHTDVGRRAE